MKKATENSVGHLQDNNYLPLEFQTFWQLCGYPNQKKAESTLHDNFIENIDFKGNKQTHVYHLTFECAKSFALLAHTEWGREVRTLLAQGQDMALHPESYPTEFLENMNRNNDTISSINISLKEGVEQYLALANRLYPEIPRGSLIYGSIRKELDNLIKNYATRMKMPVPDVYDILFQQFARKCDKKIFEKASLAQMPPMSWLESKGRIPEAYELAKKIFAMPTSSN